jgi:Mrp family chromosome partitioning ATPase
MADQQGQKDALIEKIRQLRVDGSLMGVPFSNVDDATPPTAPDTLSPARGALLAGIVGLLVGCGIAWRRAERRRPMSGSHAGAILGVPVLLDVVLARRALSELRGISSFALADRRLGSVAFALARFCDARGLRRLVVSPATAETEGPAVALALAAAIHRAGDEVLLVDVGDDGGRLTALSGLREEAGFRDVIAGRTTLESVVVSLVVADTSLRFVAMGTGPEPPAVAVATRLALMAGEALTLVDAPGLETSGQAIGAATDQAALVLVTDERSQPEALAAARTKLELAGTIVVGVIHVRRASRRLRAGRDSGVDTVSVVRHTVASVPPPLRVGRAAEPRRP